MAIFGRLAAVTVGLTNLALLAGLSRSELNGVGVYPFFWWTAEVAWNEALPSVLLVVAAGLLTSEIVLKKLEPLRGSFSGRYGVMVSALCLGGTLTGFLLASLFAVDGRSAPKKASRPKRRRTRSSALS